MLIAVYAVSLNEEKFAERFCQSAKQADLIFVADTGSTDKTVALLKKHGARVVQIAIRPWRFDDARNAALSMLPRNIDCCVSLDLDEELQPGWREEIERVWTEKTTRLRYGFDWGCGIVFQYEKIHSRFGYRWHNPCHEYPVPDRIVEVWAETQKLLVIHKPDNTKSRGQYLPLLKVSTTEDPSDPRNAFYYARELSFHSKWEESIKECQRYLALPRADWPNERCYAMRVIAKCYHEQGNLRDALSWARRACSEAPETREPWCLLAELGYFANRWEESLGAALTCIKITNRERVYTVDPSVWGSKPHDFASIAAYHLGLHELAQRHAEEAVKRDPDDLRLRANLAFCQEAFKAA